MENRSCVSAVGVGNSGSKIGVGREISGMVRAFCSETTAGISIGSDGVLLRKKIPGSTLSVSAPAKAIGLCRFIGVIECTQAGQKRKRLCANRILWLEY